jgi:hypothetical protein
VKGRWEVMNLEDGALLFSSEKPSFCKQSDQTTLTEIQFLGADYNSSSGVESYVVSKDQNKE